MRITPEALSKAEKIAMLVGSQLNLGEFRWSDWIEEPPKLVRDWIADLEARFWQAHDRTLPRDQENWRVAYGSVLQTLPQDVPLTEELLREWIPEIGRYASRREHYVACANQLAAIAGLELHIKNAPRRRTKRQLPEDEDLIALYESVRDPMRQWVLGVFIVYGLRPHEIFGLDWSNYPECVVRRSAKTGSRIVPPIYPLRNGAPVKWDLSCERLPESWMRAIGHQDWDNPTKANGDLGEYPVHAFRRWGFGITIYQCRHAFARRLKSLGVDEMISARLMGHSERIHRQTYQSSFGDRFHLDLLRQRGVDW
jgi:integrase